MALFRSDSILPSMVMCMQIEAHFQGCTTVPEQWPVTSSRWLTISCKLLSSWIPWKPGVRQVPEGSWEWANGENWLQNHLWCPSDPLGEGIDDDDDDDGFLGKKILPTGKVAFTMSFIYLCFFWVCVCVHACVYVCVCVCVHMHVFLCVSVCMCVRTQASTGMFQLTWEGRLVVLCPIFPDQMFVFFPDDPKVGIKTIKAYCQQMQQDNINRAIIIVQTGMTPSAKQVR